MQPRRRSLVLSKDGRCGRGGAIRVVGHSHLPPARLWTTLVRIMRNFEFETAFHASPVRWLPDLLSAPPPVWPLSSHATPGRAHLDDQPRREGSDVALCAHPPSRPPELPASPSSVEALETTGRRYERTWRFRVVEHIAGTIDDREAVRLMCSALAHRGRLILTVPVTPAFSEEYRDQNEYGTHPRGASGRYFFLRFHDRDALRHRLLDSVQDCRLLSCRWFGETTAGRLDAHIDQWRRDGIAATAEDAVEIAHHYREFGSIQEMPGKGACALAIEKPS